MLVFQEAGIHHHSLFPLFKAFLGIRGVKSKNHRVLNAPGTSPSISAFVDWNRISPSASPLVNFPLVPPHIPYLKGVILRKHKTAPAHHEAGVLGEPVTFCSQRWFFGRLCFRVRGAAENRVKVHFEEMGIKNKQAWRHQQQSWCFSQGSAANSKGITSTCYAILGTIFHLPRFVKCKAPKFVISKVTLVLKF